jgi:NAD(P)-dependent dehydrogenase (short-subunit alcohol dehydrogenase family)
VVRFERRRALVTGASRGIGAAVAERLAAEGADVAITARTLEKHKKLPGSLQETAARLGRYGGTVATVVADLADESHRQRIVPEAVEQLGGPLEILVNNAAGAIYQPLSDFPLRRRKLIFDLNLHAPIDLAQAVIPSMREAGEGWIVNLSSATARRGQGSSTMAIYGASKAALNRLTDALAAELRGSGIRVNSIEPRAAVRTEGAQEMVGELLRRQPDLLESMEEMVEAVVALGACPEGVTGRIAVSLDLIAEWNLVVHNLDGTPRPPGMDGDHAGYRHEGE